MSKHESTFFFQISKFYFALYKTNFLFQMTPESSQYELVSDGEVISQTKKKLVYRTPNIDWSMHL